MDFCLLGSLLDTGQPIYSLMQFYEVKSLMYIISFAFHDHPFFGGGPRYYLHFANEKTQTEKSKIVCLQSYS